MEPPLIKLKKLKFTYTFVHVSVELFSCTSALFPISRCVPVIVNTVPPAIGPNSGQAPDTVGVNTSKFEVAVPCPDPEFLAKSITMK